MTAWSLGQGDGSFPAQGRSGHPARMGLRELACFAEYLPAL